MEHRWIAQDADGEIYKFFEKKPYAYEMSWLNMGRWDKIEEGNPNPNWRNSLIDLEKEDYDIVDGTLIRKPKAKKKLTDTDLLDLIVKHGLTVAAYTTGVYVNGIHDSVDVCNKKGNIRKAIKKWLKKNVDKKELTE